MSAKVPERLFPAPSKEISEQVAIRQLLLGNNPSINNNPSVQNWKFNNSAWIRLASSVNMGDGVGANRIFKAIGLPETKYNNYRDEKLAKACVLYNGVSEVKNDSSGSVETLMRSLKPNTDYFQNIAYTNNPDWDPINDFTYGFGGNSQGIRPAPGIKSVNVGYINRGTNAKVEIEIIAFNREQLAIIDALYCHPGYNLLLEWGHTSYVNNDGTIIPQLPNNSTPAFNKIFSDKQFPVGEMYKTIQSTAKSRAGNYEAFFGPISNFSYTFNHDGTYTIKVSLISLGAIAESLKINIPSANSGFITTTANIATQIEADIQAEKDKLQDINDRLIEKTNERIFVNETTIVADNTRLNPPVTNITTTDPLTGNTSTTPIISSPKQDIQNEIDTLNAQLDTLNNPDPTEITSGSEIRLSNIISFYMYQLQTLLSRSTLPYDKPDWHNGMLILSEDGKTPNRCCRMKFSSHTKNKKYTVEGDMVVENGSGDGTESYIRLGDLIDFINNNLSIINNKKQQLLSIDGKKDQNICSRIDLTSSSDPTICIVDNPNQSILKKLKEVEGGFKKNEHQGYTMNIWVNLNFVSITAFQYTDVKGNISMFDYLKHLMNGISSCLGKINNFEIGYSNENNQITIKELIHSFPSIPKDQKIPVFNIYGFEPIRSGQEGSFVENVDFTTQISKELGAMAVISAKNGSADPLATESTPFFQYNEGLEDRTFKNKKSPFSPSTKEEKDPTNFSKEEIDEIKKLGSMFYKEGRFESEKISQYSSALTAASQYSMNYQVSTKRRSSAFLLPFNMSLSIMGMGGFKLFDRFKTDKKITPPTFTDLDFVIKSISHSVTGNKWTTKIESMCAQAHTTITNSDIIDYGAIEGIYLSVGSSSDASISSRITKQEEIDNQVKVKNLLKNAGLTQVQVAGIMGNIHKESRFNPTVKPFDDLNGYPSVGLIQWNAKYTPRGGTKNINNVYNIIGRTVEEQINSLLNNKKTSTYSAVKKYIRDTASETDPYKAAYEFAAKVEICKFCNKGFEIYIRKGLEYKPYQRSEYANDYFKRFNTPGDILSW